MTRFVKSFLASLFLATMIIAPFAPQAFSCHGKMSWRFLPIEQARAEFAKLEAEARAKKDWIPALIPPSLGKWIKYYDNPVFQPGPPGSWEEFSADCFTIGYYGGQYMMWYVGTPRSLNCQIGLSTSQDGINWTRCPENPVLRLGPTGSWDESILICQDIVFDQDENTYKMWYVGGNTEGVFAIGYATSPDGVHWDKYQRNPVLTVTEPWEGTLLEGQDVVKTPGGYMMWYGGINVSNDVSYIGLATSTDGIHWTKYPGNPILSPAEGIPREWDGYSVDTPDVTVEEGLFHMWYRGWRRSHGTSWIGHATSRDGINWERDLDNPVLLTASIPGVWDNFQIYRSRVMLGKEKDETTRIVLDKMWFTGRDYTLKSQVGFAYRIQHLGRDPGTKRRFPHINQDGLSLSIETRPDEPVDIYYFTPWLGQLTLTIYDASGNRVQTLFEEIKLPGFYQQTWDGRDQKNKPVSRGVYFCELKSETYLITRELVLD